MNRDPKSRNRVGRGRHPVILLAIAGALGLAAVSERATELRNLGIAQLENEKPAEAAKSFEELTREAPREPLGWANLAVSHLRGQQTEQAQAAITKALEIAPGRPDLLAIRADIEQWTGDQKAALATYLDAARAGPDEVEIQYALYRLASTLAGGPAGTSDEVEEAIDLSLDNLARLRPDNIVVMLHQGQRAVVRGDRTSATGAYLRVNELLWQAPPIAERAMQMMLDALESGEPDAARTPAQRLNNVLVVTPMYQQGLRELATGIQGIPLLRFDDEAEPTEFGDGTDIRFEAARLFEGAVPGAAIAVGDFDGDERSDTAWIAAGELRLSTSTGSGVVALGKPPPGATSLREMDLDNDGLLDLLAWGGERLAFWRGEPGGAFSEATDAFGLAIGGSAAVALDFDIEGDLDLVVAGGSPQPSLLRNNLAGPLEDFGARSLPELPSSDVRQALASDLDRDGDLDLLFAHDRGLSYLENLRQGEFTDATAAAGLADLGEVNAVTSADLDNDGWPDLVLAGEGLRLLRGMDGTFSPWDLGKALQTSARFDSIEALDADNDGRLDLAVTGAAGLVVMVRRDSGFEFVPIAGAPGQVSAVRAADVDLDGDLDLLVGGPDGLHQARNDGGNENAWLSLRLRGLTKGNSKNNVFGFGSTVEILNGSAYQFREATSEVTHLGLGSQPRADIARVTWTNGVPQNRIDLAANQVLVEEQLLKGSCPFLYTWDGERVRFVTDLLWGAPLGLPLAPGVWTGADPSELVLVPGAAPSGGLYDLRITEELWEAALFDRTRLWIVDAPADVEVASALRIVPGATTPEKVLATRDLRAVARAWDGRGEDVTSRVAERDEVYADGFTRSAYQGVASEPWSFTFELTPDPDQAPVGPVRLHLDGWIFPADASLNLAVAQRDDLGNPPPRLEVETSDGWSVLMPSMGFPAGKTKTMVVDTPPLPRGSRRLRIVTGQWLSWDRIAWSTAPADETPRVVARLDPASAELRYRGFSAMVRHSPNGPHGFDYATVERESPWLPFPGRYTRFGDVAELLAAIDDRYVVMGAGDELALLFDASALPPAPDGWSRSVFLESHGWDKDADRNTGSGLSVGPLPYAGMSSYPYGSGDTYPARLEPYRREWLTRIVESASRIGPRRDAATSSAPR